MKKLLSLLLALLMITTIALVACNKTPANTDGSNDLSFNQTEPDQDVEPGSDTAGNNTNEPDNSTPDDYTFADVNETVYLQKAPSVRLRTAPNNNSDSATSKVLYFGDGKSYTRTKYNEKWSELTIDGKAYYVKSYFLTTDKGDAVFTNFSGTIYSANPNIDANGNHNSVILFFFTNDTKEIDLSYYNSESDYIAEYAKYGAKLEITGISHNEEWYRVNLLDENGKVIEKDVYVPAQSKFISTTDPALGGETETEATETRPVLG